MTRKIPDVVLERYRLNELPDASARAVEAMLAADPELRARLDALDGSDEEILRAYPPRVFVRDVPAAPRRGVRRFAIAAAAVATAAIAIVASLPPAPPQEPDGVRIKGGHPSLAVYRRTAAGSERLADGAVARPGDLLRVGYVSAGRGYGVILSIDGRGAVTVHLPPSGGRAAPLTPGRTVLLDTAYELDDAPRVERFYFVTGTDPFAVAEIVSAAERAAADGAAPPVTLPLPRGLEQATFAIQKEGKK
jgi:hypothetical protein